MLKEKNKNNEEKEIKRQQKEETKKQQETKQPDLMSYYIRDLRSRQGMSISDLAGLTGVSQSYISRLELGGRKDPSISILLSIARALNADPSSLLKAAGYFVGEGEGEEAVSLYDLLYSNTVSLKGEIIERDKLNMIISIVEKVAMLDRDSIKRLDGIIENMIHLHEPLTKGDPEKSTKEENNKKIVSGS